MGDYASYCRCVGSQRLSDGKRKDSGNTKNGNKYLAWAFVEAANFAIRYHTRIKSSEFSNALILMVTGADPVRHRPVENRGA